MSLVAENEMNESAFSAMDPGVSLLASQAAIELDNLLVHGEATLEAVRLLAQRLRKSTQEIAGSSERKMVMDPPTVSIVSSALSMAKAGQVRTLAELANEAWRVSNDLHDTTPEQDKLTIEKLRSFCVSLAQNSRSYRQSILNMKPSHPYRS